MKGLRSINVVFRIDAETEKKIDERVKAMGLPDRSEFLRSIIEKELADDTDLPSSTNRLLADLNDQMKDLRKHFESTFALSYKEGGPPSKYEKLKFAIQSIGAALYRDDTKGWKAFEKKWHQIFVGELPPKKE